MFRILLLLVTTIFRCLHARRTLLLENLVLRQQLAVLKRKHPRPRLRAFDKISWVLARRFWSGWKQALIVVSPETVVGWHRTGFKLYWRAISRARRVIGRKRISKEVRNLIFRMVAERDLGRATNPRGTSDARIRCFGENDFPLDATRSERSRTRETMARVSEEPLGGNRSDGLLHRPDRDSSAALFLRPVPPLRPKRAAYGVAVLRSGSGRRNTNHALMTQASASDQLENLFHLTYK